MVSLSGLVAVLMLFFTSVHAQAELVLTFPATVSETEGTARVCVTLTPNPSEGGTSVSETVMLQTNDGSASSGADFTPLNETFVLADTGSLEECFDITILDDAALEQIEMFTVTATSSTLTVMGSPATIIVFDNDAVTVGFAQASYAFGEADSPTEVCVVILDGVIERAVTPVTVMITDIPGTALADTDYTDIVTPIPVTLTRDTPSTGSCVPITLINDDSLEIEETFVLSLSSLVSDTVIDDTLNATDIVITDDDRVTLSITNSPVDEMDGLAEACVELQGSPAQDTRSITVSTQDGSAVGSTGGNLGDYEPVNEVLQFSVGTTDLIRCVNITIYEDSNLEPIQSFNVLASAGNGDPVTGSPGTIQINSADTVTVSFAEDTYNFTEGSNGVSGEVCVVITDGEIQGGVSADVTVSATDGSATAATNDYVFTGVTLQFSSSTPAEGLCFPAGVLDDNIVEDFEEYTLSLNSSAVSFLQEVATIIITDDDVDCGPLGTPQNGQVSVPSTVEGSVATYSCNSGFTLQGGPNRTCQADGMWSGVEPTCMTDSADCGPLGTPQNGQVSVPSTVEGSVATYSCNSGFTLQGGPNRTCQADGMWSGDEPSCMMDSADCGPLANPSNGQVLTVPSTVEGSVATYSCNSGFTLQGGPTRTCQADGMWSGDEPSCMRNPADCGSLANPSNGQVLTVPSTVEGSVATYSCNSGFTLQGGPTRTCQADGMWSGDEPSCMRNPADCGSLANPSNGQVLTVPSTIEGSVATYSCNSGFTLQGGPTRTCQADGMWSGDEPSCMRNPADCGSLANPSNGQVLTVPSTIEGSVATYSCNSGFTLQGGPTRTCQADGMWSGDEPFCMMDSTPAPPPVDCGTLPNPPFGRVRLTSTTVGSRASYTCYVGYRLSGSANRECQSNGRWTGFAPRCIAVRCRPLYPPYLSRIFYTRGFTVVSSAYYYCFYGYRLVGNRRRVCRPTGLWTGTTPRCLIKRSRLG